METGTFYKAVASGWGVDTEDEGYYFCFSVDNSDEVWSCISSTDADDEPWTGADPDKSSLVRQRMQQVRRR